MPKKQTTSGSLIVSYRRALQSAEAKFAEKMKLNRSSLTYRQYIVLNAVAEAPNASQTDLVTATAMDRSTMADVISRLIAQGLLLRERSAEDTRTNMVSLSGEGKTVLSKARQANRLANRVLAEQLPALLKIAA